MTRLPAIALLAAVLLVGVTACGSSSSSSSSSSAASASSSAALRNPASAPGPPPKGSLSVAADPTGALKYTKSSLSAKAGKVTIDFSNQSQIPHNLTVQQGTSGPVLGATPTFPVGSHTLTLTLKPGTYTFYCSVPGHRAAGMHGTLTIS